MLWTVRVWSRIVTFVGEMMLYSQKHCCNVLPHTEFCVPIHDSILPQNECSKDLSGSETNRNIYWNNHRTSVITAKKEESEKSVQYLCYFPVHTKCLVFFNVTCLPTRNIYNLSRRINIPIYSYISTYWKLF